MRTCSRCRKEEHDIEFEGNRRVCNSCRNSKRDWAKRNPDKNREHSAKYRKENPEKAAEMVRNANLKRLYGITIAQYEDLLSEQDNRCAVCNRDASEFKVRLSVDHDHKTGEIFGLLCTYCNHRFIGRDRDPLKYQRALIYLSKGTGLFVPPKPKKNRSRK